jgi:hypothetical protein
MQIIIYLVLVLSLVAFSPIVSADCECGFVDENGNVWMDALVVPFADAKIFDNRDFYVNDYTNAPGMGSFYYHMTPKNIFKDDQGNVVLRVLPPKNSIIESAQFSTRREDFLYGTFRSVLEFPQERGTCMGFFHYHNDTEEIDVEYLGNDPEYLYLSNKRNIYPTNEAEFDSIDYRMDGLPNQFRDYRFDWFPGKTDFYVDDALVSTLGNEPSSPGAISFMNWANGDPFWSGTPNTIVDSRVKNFAAFFNTTNSFVVHHFERLCATARDSDQSTCPISVLPRSQYYGFDQNIIRRYATFEQPAPSIVDGYLDTSSSSSMSIFDSKYTSFVISLLVVSWLLV